MINDISSSVSKMANPNGLRVAGNSSSLFVQRRVQDTDDSQEKDTIALLAGAETTSLAELQRVNKDAYTKPDPENDDSRNFDQGPR